MNTVIKFICAALVVSSCSTQTSTNSVVSAPPIEIAQHEYVGEWIGTYEGEPFFDVSITNTTFEVHWASDSSVKPLYWTGGFDAKRLVSEPNEQIMGRLLKTSNQQEEIVLKNAADELTFTVNLIGIDQTIIMKKV